jgi:hypothetical protein
MDITIMNKILWHIFPEDIIREISSYFIFKILKTDKRIIYFEDFLSRRNSCLYGGVYSDGKFRYQLFHPPGSHLYFCMQSLPSMFIEYTFGNFRSKKQNNIRFFIEHGKCEEFIDGYWTIKT